jgi:hypothetical protein
MTEHDVLVGSACACSPSLRSVGGTSPGFVDR